MMKPLKTLAAVALAALTLSLSGCCKDPADLIVGSWEATSETLSYSSSNGTESGPHTNTFGDGTGLTLTITFNENGTGSYTSTYTHDGETLPFTDTFAYTVHGHKLTMTMNSDGENGIYNIDDIDKKEMTLSGSTTFEEGPYEGGEGEPVTYTTTERYTIKFKKV